MGHLQLRGQLIHILERRWRLHAAVLVTPATDAIQTFREILVLSLALGHLSTHFPTLRGIPDSPCCETRLRQYRPRHGRRAKNTCRRTGTDSCEERQQFGMTGDFELNIEILRGFCLVRGQAIDFDCRLLCFQLALATRSNTEPGSKTGVCTPVESISYASDTDCWAVSAAGCWSATPAAVAS